MEGQEAEEDREAVFAFRDPGDGFDAEGMKRPEEGEEETRRDGRRAAGGGAGRRETAGEAEEKKKEEEGGGGVEEDVREMERPRVVAEQGNVQHVGNPEEGDVHGGGGDGGEEGIADGGQAESPDDERVGRNKRKVVQGDEFKSDGGEVQKEGEKKGQNGGKNETGPEKSHRGGEIWKVSSQETSPKWHAPIRGHTWTKVLASPE